MSQRKRVENDPAEITLELRDWLDNVIVPALVDRYLAQRRPETQSASVMETNAPTTDQIKMGNGPVPQVDKTKRMLTVGEAAQRLGLSQGTVRAWIARRRITYVRLGRAIRIPASAVEEIIERGTVPAKTRRQERS